MKIKRFKLLADVFDFLRFNFFRLIYKSNKIEIDSQRNNCFYLVGKKPKSFYVLNLKKGNYTLLIEHRDEFIKEKRKSLYLKFKFYKMFSSAANAQKFDLNFNKKKNFIFSYMGGGKLNNKKISQQIVINIKGDAKWILFNFHNSFQRFVNIENIKFLSNNFEKIKIDNKFIEEKNIENAINIIYADIDLNIIDGSSVWLSSVASIFSKNEISIIISKKSIKNNLIISNIESKNNLRIISPDDFDYINDEISQIQAINLIRAIDNLSASIQSVVVRGLDASYDLVSDRQFHNRSNVYLTDFYSHGSEGFIVEEKKLKKLCLIASQSGRMLVQNQEIKAAIHEVTQRNFSSLELPPAVPRVDIERVKSRNKGLIKIGYAGKIAPQWGITELFDWTEILRSEGINIELTVVANKISGYQNADKRKAFRSNIIRKMDELQVNHIDGLNRKAALEKMAEMDFVWCYRPASFEDVTLELSTKLVESVSYKFAALCYPNAINRRSLGEHYPFFISGLNDMRSVLRDKIDTEVPTSSVQSVLKNHSLDEISSRLGSKMWRAQQIDSPQITFAGHDFKFIDAYYSALKANGHPVRRDVWEWGEAVDIDASRSLMKKSDIIFCEWGLANAVWYSQNIVARKRLFIRIHLQEINPRAVRFGGQIQIENVEKIIFVSDRVRKKALELWNWPAEKTVVIPNFVLDDELTFEPKMFNKPVKLGMMGIIPQRKRFDRAVDLLKALQNEGIQANLTIKGPRPETLAYMHAPGRAEELVFYQEVYDNINSDPALKNAISFEPWSIDVADWYKKVDYILSPSDFESFHYALADGVLSGCFPLVWPWDEADAIYSDDWIVDTVEKAVERIVGFGAATSTLQKEMLLKKRLLVQERYGKDVVFKKLDALLGMNGENKHQD